MTDKALKELPKSFFRNRVNIAILVTVLLFSTIVCVFYARIPKVVLYPNLNAINYGCFTDNGNNGTSTYSNENISDTVISFDFNLAEGFYNPYVGINLAPDKNSFINLKYMNRLKLDLSIEGLKNIGIYIGQPGTDSLISSENNLTFYHSLEILGGRNIYNINLNEFKVPDWAINYSNLHKRDQLKLNSEQISFINLTTAYPTKAGDSGNVKIYSIEAYRDNKMLILILLSFIIFTITLLYFIYRFYNKTTEKSDTITITYNPIQVDVKTNKRNDYINFIGNNFHNPELTLELVAKQTATGQRVIANDILESYGCNFKTYVNQIRINESKRLLKETKLNIGEIAYKVGFNSQSHFNRVFKNIMDISPTSFRDGLQ